MWVFKTSIGIPVKVFALAFISTGKEFFHAMRLNNLLLWMWFYYVLYWNSHTQRNSYVIEWYVHYSHTLFFLFFITGYGNLKKRMRFSLIYTERKDVFFFNRILLWFQCYITNYSQCNSTIAGNISANRDQLWYWRQINCHPKFLHFVWVHRANSCMKHLQIFIAIRRISNW